MMIALRLVIALVFAPILFAACCFGALYCFAALMVDFVLFGGSKPDVEKSNGADAT